MKGWKTKVGASLIALGELVQAIVPEYSDVGSFLKTMGSAVTAYGIAHKIEKGFKSP